MEEMKIELLILFTFFNFPTFNWNKVTYKNNTLFRKKMFFFFFSKIVFCFSEIIRWKNRCYHKSWHFICSQKADIMKADILKMRIVHSVSIHTTSIDNERATSERDSRNFCAKTAIYVFTRREGSANEIRCSEAD